jgi:acyl carrier protein
MNVEQEVIDTLHAVLGIDARKRKLTADTALLGSLAELDSMAVATILTSFEERFGFAIADDEVDGATFASVASLARFVQEKLEP